MLNREKVIEAFQAALEELQRGISEEEIVPTQVADRACEIYTADRSPGEKEPSIWTFRSYVTGRKADEEIISLITQAGVKGRGKVDKALLLQSFEFALELKARKIAEGGMTPRGIALLAYRVYCAELPPDVRRPSGRTFSQMVCGRKRRQDVAALLERDGVRPRRSARLDRVRLMEAFQKAIERLGGRIAKGWVRPLHVAERAHRFYVEGSGEGHPRPSRLTFHHLVYGKTADPEVSEFLKKKLQ